MATINYLNRFTESGLEGSDKISLFAPVEQDVYRNRYH